MGFNECAVFGRKLNFVAWLRMFWRYARKGIREQCFRSREEKVRASPATATNDGKAT